MKRDEKIAKLLKEHGKQSPPSVDFTDMVMAQITEAFVSDLDVIRTVVSSQKEELIQSPSLAFEAELFEKIAQQNTKAKVRPIFSHKSLFGMLASVFLISTIYTVFVQNTDSQYFDYEIFYSVFQNSTSVFIIITAIIIGGGMYIFDYLLREKFSLKF